MINVAELARRLGSVVTGAGGRSGLRISADEVLAYLRPDGAGALMASLERRELLLLDRLIATLPQLVAEERLPRRHPGFRRYFDALPRILFFYGRGYTPEQIAGEMTFIATDFGVEAVLGIVAEAVSRRVAQAA